MKNNSVLALILVVLLGAIQVKAKTETADGGAMAFPNCDLRFVPVAIDDSTNNAIEKAKQICGDLSEVNIIHMKVIKITKEACRSWTPLISARTEIEFECAP